MSHRQQVCQCLCAIEHTMKEHHVWQTRRPDAQACNSSAPFCLDTLHPLEWLQWVLIPRMQLLLENGAPLPEKFSLTPYYEEALDKMMPGRVHLLLHLTHLDALFSGA